MAEAIRAAVRGRPPAQEAAGDVSDNSFQSRANTPGSNLWYFYGSEYLCRCKTATGSKTGSYIRTAAFPSRDPRKEGLEAT